MNILAIIPARGGSKGIPDKNIRDFCGKPLIAYSIAAAQSLSIPTRVVVSTDSKKIASISEGYGAEVVSRPDHLATDLSSSESALENVLDTLKEKESYSPDLVIFLQATSPLRRKDELEQAVEKFLTTAADSLVSVVPFHRLIWRMTNRSLVSFNYDYQHRLRRQDRENEYVESGSFYIFKPEILKKHKNRLGGKIIHHELSFWSGLEIDTNEDWELGELVYQHLQRKRKGTHPEDVQELFI